MKTIRNYFDQNPRGTGWLHRLGLKANELVLVEGHTYRYSVENGGRDHVLTPAEALVPRTSEGIVANQVAHRVLNHGPNGALQT
jgi:hypothetical protein